MPVRNGTPGVSPRDKSRLVDAIPEAMRHTQGHMDGFPAFDPAILLLPTDAHIQSALDHSERLGIAEMIMEHHTRCTTGKRCSSFHQGALGLLSRL